MKLPTSMSVLSVLLLAIAPHPALHAQTPLGGRVDSLVRRAQAPSGIPGLAIVVADREGIVFVRGYGYRRSGSDSSVDAETEFAIASLTKAFTASAVAQLVVEGRLSWDDPVRSHLPWFQTSDPWVTERATVGDLAAMRVGWPSGDSLAFAVRSQEELQASLPGIPVGAFRATHGQAGNLSYAILGQVLAQVAGTSWEDAVTARLLTPLGMSSTFTTRRAALSRGNVAESHVQDDSGTRPSQTTMVSAVLLPAAALYSTASDLARWIQFQLGGSRSGLDSPTADSARAICQSPHVLLGSSYQSIFRAPSSPVAYGYGWVVYNYRGTKVLEHAGAWAGYTSYLVLLPERGLGFAILTNLRLNAALDHIRSLRTELANILVAQ